MEKDTSKNNELEDFDNSETWLNKNLRDFEYGQGEILWEDCSE